MTSLQGKTAIVTGASSGIGKAIAVRLAEEGANVILAARSMDKLAELEEKINGAGGGEAIAVPTDMALRESVEAMAGKAKAAYGAVDLLVNNAGQMLSGTVRSGKTDEWENMIDVNIKGVLYGIHAVLPHMIGRGTGHIINIDSVSGHEVTKTSTVYSATKFAVRAISMGLEKELARTGVRVTNISPGMVDTPLMGARSVDRKILDPENIAQAIVYAATQPPHVNVNEITVRPV
ncbi:SDR family oxidoreductase [Edaphobacillus lindanitolerans]|uniref:NADP-dependent 3-hydroxy acid dehydrogenase YdfG n=1 Tax=Edaphobacillus lindanitolerans TaxID=550447 RepID=A0A1U7PT56_9BACI|nr:SDR family oxidoreductase [Edaphobacillus lindanitolerans]SIT92632.1 NADP-dependent 3-hydroxy acid dehydrogenase YdfG [Edaphobacillus lindanitolerans]